MVKFKNRSPFLLNEKQKRAENYYMTVDLMFMQEAGSVEWKQQEGYTLHKNHDSLIVYRTSKFGNINWEETEKWSKLLDINADTAIVITEQNYLLVSSHFKSSSPHFLEQEEELFKVLNYVLDYYKGIPDFRVIVGADANHFIENP